MRTDFDTALLNFTALVCRYRDSHEPADLEPVMTAISAANATGDRDLSEWFATIASAGLGITVRIAPTTAEHRPARVH